MSRDRELENKYNLALSHIQSLTETLKIKEQQWDEMAKTYRVIDDNTRDLCKKILAKDSSQINLGSDEGSWMRSSTAVLVRKASESYDKISKSKSDLQEKIFNQYQEEQQKNFSLKEEIEYLKNQMTGNKESDGEEQKTYEEYKAEQNQKEKEEKIKQNIVPEVKKNIQENNVEVHTDQTEIDFFADAMMDASNAMKIQKGQGLNHPPKTNRKNKAATKFQNKIKNAEIKEAKETYYESVDLAGIEVSLSPIQKELISILGGKGFSDIQEITNEMLKNEPKRREREKSFSQQLYMAYSELAGKRVLEVIKVRVPLREKSQISLVRFTITGERLYKRIYGTNPVATEMSSLIKEHDNLEHAYGIKTLFIGMLQTGAYKVCDMHCRKNNNLSTGEGNKSYIPDIYVEPYSRDKKIYIEYERGLGADSVMKDKCDKMILFTRELYFITENKDTVNRLYDSIVKWKTEAVRRGTFAKVFITTLQQFHNAGYKIFDKNAWVKYIGSEDIEEKTE